MEFNVDLHVHSSASGDSDAAPEELILRAIKIGLYGIAFTEHYSYEASEPVEVLSERYRKEILVLRGVEVSAADGHCLVYGVNTDRLLTSYMPMADIVHIVNRHGGVVIPSHPYRGINSLGDAVKTMKGICALEGYNGCNLHAFNVRAVEAAAALRLPFTGGSDAHDYASVGLCYTAFAEMVTRDNFVELLKSGKYHGIDTRKTSRVSFPNWRYWKERLI
jgi:predicted metal-dependent phosphoesterase TrpH